MSEKARTGARLRAERKARGLTVADLAELFRDVASDRVARRLPRLKDLERTIRGHEAGEHAVGPRYRLLYAAALNTPEHVLFGLEVPCTAPSEPDDHERMVLAARNPLRLDTAVVEGLARTLADQRRIEDVVGSHAVIGAARGHLGLVLRLLRGARGPLSKRVAAVASEAAQFNGWLSTAVGAHGEAGPLYDQALRLGMQAGDENLAATALSMRGHLAWVNGDFREMAELSEAAVDLAVARGTRTVAAQQRGRALALLGERQDALRAIGEAEETFSKAADHDDPDGLYFYGVEMLTMQRGLILRYVGEHAAAAETIMNGIEAMPESIRNSEWVAWYRVQAAGARAFAGDVEGAIANLRDALHTLSATGGMKTLGDIAHVQRYLKTHYSSHRLVAGLAEVVPAT